MSDLNADAALTLRKKRGFSVCSVAGNIFNVELLYPIFLRKTLWQGLLTPFAACLRRRVPPPHRIVSAAATRGSAVTRTARTFLVAEGPPPAETQGPCALFPLTGKDRQAKGSLSGRRALAASRIWRAGAARQARPALTRYLFADIFLSNDAHASVPTARGIEGGQMTQQAEVDGEHNTVVQINGSGNYVVPGGRRFSLPLPGDAARSEAQSDTLSKFYPGSRSTTFIGREREWKMLDAFLDAEAPLSFLVLTGDGGSGKTRLALELCLARRELGWEAGFISSRELDDVDASTGWRGDRDTLIVVDYAASRAQQLRDVLRALSNQPDSGRRLRFLLLERTAKDDAGWLSTLLGDGGERSHAVRRLQYGNSPHALSPLTGRETLLALARDFLTALGRPDDAWQRDEDLVRRLLDAAWGGNPLYLMLAAYTMLYRDDRSTTWTREKLAEEFAGKEMERIRGQASARGLDGDFLVELAACVTLAQGVTKEEFGVWAKKIHAAEGVSGRGRSYVDALPEVLPHQPEGEENRLPPPAARHHR